MKSRKLRVGIVGTGGIAQGVHIPGWKDNPDAEITAVCDIIPERVQEVAAENNVPHVFEDYRKLVKLKDVDVVDVCTPNRVHTPVSLAALAAGKHVLCEKPLAVTPREIEKLIKAARDAKRVLMVGQNNRYRGISQAIKRWIEAGNLGKPYYARSWAIRRNLLPPAVGFITKEQSGGGPCLDIGVHCLDLAMWLMDFPEPVTVTGAATNQLAKKKTIPGAWGDWDAKRFDVEDFACGMVRFASGAMLSLESSWLGHTPEPEDMSCMILGDKAGVSWPSGQVCTVSNGALIDAKIQPLPMRPQTHTTEIWEFYDAVVNHKPAPVPAEQALKVIKILDGIYRSQKTGREVRL